MSGSGVASPRAKYCARAYSHKLALRMSKLGPTKTGACGTRPFAMNSAAHSATTFPSSANRASGSTLRTMANMPPIQDTTGARKNEIGRAKSTNAASHGTFNAGNKENTAPCGDAGRNGANPNRTEDNTTSVRTDSATMAESAVTRPSGRTKKAATASATTSQATSALRP